MKKKKITFTVQDACNLSTSKSEKGLFNNLLWNIIAEVKHEDIGGPIFGIYLVCEPECDTGK